MITAVDTNILLDIFLPNVQFGPSSQLAIDLAFQDGALVVCDIVYAELVPAFGIRSRLDHALRDLGIERSPINSDIAWQAGLRWMRYRQAGGPRTRILADFLIGAHALASADSFLTRDSGFFRTYFPELALTRSTADR